MRTLKYGQSLTLGGAKLECVGPIHIKRVRRGATAENNNSLVLRVTYGSRSVLLTGDATGEELGMIHKRNPAALRVDVLKNPHHNGYARGRYGYFGMKYVVVSTSNARQPSAEML